MPSAPPSYSARLEIDHPERLNRVTTLFRLVLIIPIAILFGILSGETLASDDDLSETVSNLTRGIASALFFATVLMILFRKRYPRWWFDFALELTRFSTRLSAYGLFLTDQYPSTVDEQAVHLDIDYPDAEHDLNRWLPLVKRFLAIPHFMVLVAWFAILFTGRYPRGMFDFVVGVYRWSIRVSAYALLLTTNRYPHFSLD